MNILSFLGANGLMIAFFVFDIILILAAIGISIWFYIKYLRQHKSGETSNNKVEKIDDDTYIIETNDELASENEDEQPEQKINRVEHSASQIAEINEPSTQELKSKTVVHNNEVEKPKAKIVKKEEIENFVVVDGVKKTKTEPEKKKLLNRGTNAYQDSSNFFDNIKKEQEQTAETSKKKKNNS